MQAARGLHCIWDTKITSSIYCESWASCLQPSTGTFFRLDSKVHGPVHHSVAELLCLPRSSQHFLTSLPGVFLGRYPMKGTAVLWTRLCKNTWRNLNKQDPSGENFTPVAREAASPISQRNSFSRSLRSKSSTVASAPALSVQIRQFFQTCVINIPPRGPIPEHRWSSSAEKISRENCATIVTQGVLLKDNDAFSLWFSFLQGSADPGKTGKWSQQNTALILESGYLG